MDVSEATALLNDFWRAANDSDWGQAVDGLPRVSWDRPMDVVANRRGALPLLALSPDLSTWPSGIVAEPVTAHLIAPNPVTAGRDVWALHDGWFDPFDHYEPSPPSLVLTVNAITAANTIAQTLDQLDAPNGSARAYRRESDAMRAFADSLAPFLDSLSAPWHAHALSVIDAQRKPQTVIVSRGKSARVPI